jgi:hypothetical protein
MIIEEVDVQVSLTVEWIVIILGIGVWWSSDTHRFTLFVGKIIVFQLILKIGFATVVANLTWTLCIV